MDINELLVANVGFSIVEEDRAFGPDGELRGLRTLTAEDSETGVGPGVDTPWWTTTGDDPVIHDQYVQADMDASAGGWSYIGPELGCGLEDDTPVHWEYHTKWADWTLYLKRQKEDRQKRCLVVFEWVRHCTSKALLKQKLEAFERFVKADKKRCMQSRDWTNSYLTKEQATKLGRYFRIRLQML